VLTVGERTAVGYERYFGLVEPPFSLTPNPRFLFESRSHSSAFEQVTYALERREPIIVVTGEIGTGKTMLCRTVLEKLEKRTFLSIVTDPRLGVEDLLTQVLDDFGVLPYDRTQVTRASRHDLVRTLEQFVKSLGSLKAHAVIMIDEAQHLQPEVLEQIRLLSNIETDDQGLLQIVLVGQPDLEELLSRPDMRQLEQRITRRHRLEPLGPEEVRRYIERRLNVAHGRTDGDAFSNHAVPPVSFTPDAMQIISVLSQGLPRVINILCDRSLEIGCQERQSSIDRETVIKAARALKISGAYSSAVEFHEEPAPSRRTVLIAAAVVAVVVLVGAVWFAMRLFGTPEPGPAEAPPAATAPPPKPAAPRDAPQAAPAAANSASKPAPGAPTSPAASATTPPTQAPPPSSPPAPVPPAPAPAAAQPPAVAPSTAAGAATPTPGAFPERFRIVVASFRTEGRTNTLAEEVKALGLPVYTRFVADWYQVIVGPYNSQAAALEAQQKLTAAQILNTTIISNQPKPRDPAAAPDPAPAVR
jgi:general secretion pathway protein A